MSDPVWLQVCKAIETRLQVISVDNGFNTDVGTNVKRGHYVFDKIGLALGAIVYYVDSNERGEKVGDRNIHSVFNLKFVVAASKKLGENESPQDVAALLAEDLTKAMEGATDSLSDMTFNNLLLRNGGLRLIADSAIDDPFKRHEQHLTNNYGQYYQVYEGQFIKKPGVI